MAVAINQAGGDEAGVAGVAGQVGMGGRNGIQLSNPRDLVPNDSDGGITDQPVSIDHRRHRRMG